MITNYFQLLSLLHFLGEMSVCKRFFFHLPWGKGLVKKVVSAKLSIKKCQVRGVDKPEVEARKTKIQLELRKEIGILVEIPMAGSGNTNNANTAYRS